ncbi:MAG: flagellar filament capping protein FliD [Armatimonadota bacterium]
MAGLMSVSGLASGLQTDTILAKLQQVEQAPIVRMQQQQSQLNTKIQAWSALNTRVLAVKEKAAALAKLAQNVSRSVSSSSDKVTVSATSSAVIGTYTFTVNTLASYHQMTSQSFSDTDVTSVGTGTFSITSNGKTTEINVDHLSLEGLRNAINSSDAGVQAMIVSSGGTNPTYRLVLTTEQLGTEGTMTINSTLSGGSAPMLSTLQAAADTTLTFGSGANAFQVTRSANKITDVITGVTINLSEESVGNTVTLNVSQNVNSIRSAVQDLVTQYNAMLDFMAQQSSYDPDSGATGVLFGEYQMTQIQNELSRLLTGQVSGLPAGMSSVTKIGIGFDEEGKLVLNTEALNKAIEEDVDGVLRLFSATGTAANNSVQFVSSDEHTKSSDLAGYAVNITQAATQAKLVIETTGDGLPAALGQNETLTINGKTVELTAGMTPAQVIAAINAKTDDTGVRASLTGADGNGAGNFLSLTRTAYGSAYSLNVVSSVAADATSTGIGTTALTQAAAGDGNIGVAGRDVAGTINGKVATGQGQLLTSADGDSKGMKLLITGTTAGDYGNLIFSLGVGARIDSMLEFVTDAEDGSLQQAQDTLQKRIDAMDEDIESMGEAVQRYMDRMRAQFNAMEVALSKLQNQGSQLSNLLAQLPSSD